MDRAFLVENPAASRATSGNYHVVVYNGTGVLAEESGVLPRIWAGNRVAVTRHHALTATAAAITSVEVTLSGSGYFIGEPGPAPQVTPEIGREHV